MNARPLLPAILALAAAAALRAQAAVEYALKSSGSAVSGTGDGSIAGCPVDSAILSCLGHQYPRTAIIVAVLAGLFILRFLARRVVR